MEYSVSLNGTDALIFLGVSVIIVLFMLISKWRIYIKANKPGWAVLIPIYNDIVFFEVAGMNVLMVILLFIPIANVIVYFISNVKVAKKFNKGTGFGIFMALFPLLGYPILAFGKSVYEGNKDNLETQSSILDVNTSGVPNTSEESEFQYGYEKEATVVMDPVNSTTETDNSQNVSLDTSLENINTDNIVETENSNALNASTETMTEPVEETPVEVKPEEVINLGTTESINNVEATNPVDNNLNVGSEINQIEEIVEPQNNTLESQPIENSALDAQLNDINSTTILDTENIENSNTTSEVQSEDDFTEVN